MLPRLDALESRVVSCVSSEADPARPRDMLKSSYALAEAASSHGNLPCRGGRDRRSAHTESSDLRAPEVPCGAIAAYLSVPVAENQLTIIRVRPDDE